MAGTEQQQHEIDRAKQSRRITWTAIVFGLIAVGIYAGYFVFKYVT